MAVEARVDSSIWNGGISKFIKSPEPLPVHNHLIDTSKFYVLFLISYYIFLYKNRYTKVWHHDEQDPTSKKQSD